MCSSTFFTSYYLIASNKMSIVHICCCCWKDNFIIKSLTLSRIDIIIITYKLLSRRDRSVMGKKKNNSKVSSNKNKSSTALSYRCEILQAKNINAHVIIYRNFLTEDEINTLKNLGPTGIKMGHDRDNDLSFEHEVWRFENELEKNAKELYDKVLHVMFLTDEQIWKKIL